MRRSVGKQASDDEIKVTWADVVKGGGTAKETRQVPIMGSGLERLTFETVPRI